MLINLKRNKGSGEMEGMARDFRTEGRGGQELSGSTWVEVREAQ